MDGIPDYNDLRTITPLCTLKVLSDPDCFHRVMDTKDRLPSRGNKVITPDAATDARAHSPQQAERPETADLPSRAPCA